jgi:hypothetical protein
MLKQRSNECEKKCFIKIYNKKNWGIVFSPLGATRLGGVLTLFYLKIPLGRTQSSNHPIVLKIYKIKNGFFPLGKDTIRWLSLIVFFP